MTKITLAHSELTNTIYAIIGKEKIDVTEQAIAEVKAIKALEQEPQTGHWIKLKGGILFPNHDFECSVCGNTLDFSGVNSGRGNANYCPNCGARMSEVSE